MTQENIIKLHKHFSYLAEGNFLERDFDSDLGSGGISSMGKMTPERRALIISDSKKNKEDLERKFSFLKEKEEVKEKVSNKKSKEAD